MELIISGFITVCLAERIATPLFIIHITNTVAKNKNGQIIEGLMINETFTALSLVMYNNF